MDGPTSSTPLVVAYISPYPDPSDVIAPPSGVALFSQFLVSALRDVASDDVTVFAARDRTFEQEGVLGVWRPGPFIRWQILRAAGKHKPDVIHLQHELRLYGDPLSTLLVLSCLRPLQRRMRTVATVHGVIRDLRELLPGSGLVHGLKIVAGQAIVTLNYRMLGRYADALIVHHQHLADSLSNDFDIDPAKVHVIPLPALLDMAPRAPEWEGGKPLRVLVLGFLTDYKWPEVMLDLARSGLSDGIEAVFAVGRNPRNLTPEYAQRYELLRTGVIDGYGSEAWRGYVPDEELASLLEDVDVMLLPYTHFIAVSGVAGLALSAGLLICYSEQLNMAFGSSALQFSLDAHSVSTALANARTALADGSAAAIVAQQRLALESSYDTPQEAASKTDAVYRAIVASGPPSGRPMCVGFRVKRDRQSTNPEPRRRGPREYIQRWLAGRLSRLRKDQVAEGHQVVRPPRSVRFTGVRLVAVGGLVIAVSILQPTAFAFLLVGYSAMVWLLRRRGRPSYWLAIVLLVAVIPLQAFGHSPQVATVGRMAFYLLVIGLLSDLLAHLDRDRQIAPQHHVCQSGCDAPSFD
jgi:glycosyltransferase involved in cell wall biosynthesis